VISRFHPERSQEFRGIFAIDLYAEQSLHVFVAQKYRRRFDLGGITVGYAGLGRTCRNLVEQINGAIQGGDCALGIDAALEAMRRFTVKAESLGGPAYRSRCEVGALE
jgi:hypothetical protein